MIFLFFLYTEISFVAYTDLLLFFLEGDGGKEGGRDRGSVREREGEIERGRDRGREGRGEWEAISQKLTGVLPSVTLTFLLLFFFYYDMFQMRLDAPPCTSLRGGVIWLWWTYYSQQGLP